MITITYFPKKRINISESLIKALLFIFLLTTFVSREFSNIIILTLLFISILYLATNKIYLEKIDKILLVIIVFFTLLVLVISFIHSSPISEVDTYLRVILLFPIYLLMKEVKINEKQMSWLFITCIISSIILFFFYGTNLYHDNRYTGSSSVVLTYSNMIMTIILFIILMLTQKEITSQLLKYIIIFTGFFLVFETATKGSILSFILTIPILIYLDRKLFKPIIALVVVISIVSVSTPLSNRIASFVDSITTINFDNITNSNSENFSENERIYYYQFSLSKISSNPLIGIGPHNFKIHLKNQITNSKLNITVSDHAHNEFLDIFVKFGIFTVSMFIIMLIYFFVIFFKHKNTYISRCGIITIISQVGYMLTQSQFAHNQAIVFFFFLLYLLLSQVKPAKERELY